MAETSAQKRDRQYNEAVEAKKANPAKPEYKAIPAPGTKTNTQQSQNNTQPPAGMGGYSGKGTRMRKIYIDEITEEDHRRGYTNESAG